MFAVLACFGIAGAANAQWARQTTFDVGAIRLTRDDFADTDGVNVAALWSRWNERISVIASGAATRASDGRSTGIALGSASYAVPLRRLRFELGGTGTVLGTSNLQPSSSWQGFGRAHWLGDAVGVWAGGGGGRVRTERRTYGAATGDFGVWARRGEHRVSIFAAPVRTSTITTFVFSDETVLRLREPVGYTDFTLAAHGGWGAFQLDAVAVLRDGWQGNVRSAATASVGGAWWMTPHIGLAAAVGRQLSDPMRGTARARYASVALRLSAERHRVERRPTEPRVAAGEASLVAVPGGGGRATIRVHAPGARRVEIMGDLTGWEPMELDQRDGRWERRLTAASGPHHVLVRIDGGAWMPPSNLPRIDDEYGGRVGLVIVP
ncbi:MAG: hypothetical protein K0S86_1305 [Geminicoccaceae bacterium]|nr:hypothetical protein [Geminicoccaceae bacterium]